MTRLKILAGSNALAYFPESGWPNEMNFMTFCRMSLWAEHFRYTDQNFRFPGTVVIKFFVVNNAGTVALATIFEPSLMF